MTDKELIRRLRSQIGDDVQEIYSHEALFRLAADRIELLATTNEQLVATNEALTAENKRLGQQCEGLMQAGMNNGQALILAEAKLAECEARIGKALVEALRFYADEDTYETQYVRLSCDCCTDIFEPINEDKGAKARAALAAWNELQSSKEASRA